MGNSTLISTLVFLFVDLINLVVSSLSPGSTGSGGFSVSPKICYIKSNVGIQIFVILPAAMSGGMVIVRNDIFELNGPRFLTGTSMYA